MLPNRSKSVALALVLGSGALLAGCGGGRSGPESSAAAAAGEDVEILKIEPREMPELKPVSAVLTNRDVGAARARIGGTLVELSVREGDVVEEGQVIAVVADDRRTLEANAARSGAAAAEAQAIEASATLKRVEELFAQGVYAQARLDQARAAFRSADAQLKSARAGSAALAEVASQGKVLAPAAGRVTRAPVPQGAVIMAGELVAEVATGRRVLRAELPEANSAGVQESRPISVARVDGTGEFVSKIVQVYPAVQDGKIIIDIDATAFDGGFVGMRVPVLIPIGTRSAFVVPERFITLRYGVDYVTVLTGDDHALDIPVQRGRSFGAGDDATVEILSGLRSGDVIVAHPGKTGRAIASNAEPGK
jgi:RND family efflux transporter MFP subunit